MLTNLQASLILNALPSVGPIAVQKLRKALNGELARAFSLDAGTLRSFKIAKDAADKIAAWQQFFNLEREEAAMAKIGAIFIPFEDPRYPESLRERPDVAPIGLYLRGNADALKNVSKQSVAFVGTRRCTLYGKTVATKFAENLAARGFAIVSGGAAGIDAASHRGALDGTGTTIAVLGNGIDRCYPAENRELFLQIIEHDGAILSEFPIGRSGDRQTFPQRNRIVAALAPATFVVESDIKGGSLITANFTLEFGKTLFALPGRIDVPASAGCNQLIRDGAICVTSPDDIAHELDGFGPAGTPNFPFVNEAGNALQQKARLAEKISPDAKQIFDLLATNGKLNAENLAEKSGLPATNISVALLMLELDNLVTKFADGSYEVA